VNSGTYGLKILALILLILSPTISAKHKVTLGVLVFPPHSQIEELTNECVGRFISITDEILAEYNIELDVVCAPPIRIYRMLRNADVDFTINIRSTKALPEDIVFVETAFSTLSLNLYAHKGSEPVKSIAAIRGFGYHGFRTKLLAQEYEFFDLPTSTSAIQLFLKERTTHLISYRSPVDYHIQKNKLNINSSVSVQPLIEVPTYYAISGKSPYLEILQAALDDYSTKHHLTFFDSLN
jgi:polar amino acid transport system substrate-binding protein